MSILNVNMSILNVIMFPFVFVCQLLIGFSCCVDMHPHDNPSSSSDGQELHEQGCYKDDEFDRDLQFEISPTITDLTPSKCIEACQAKQFRYAGTQVCLNERTEQGGSSSSL